MRQLLIGLVLLATACVDQGAGTVVQLELSQGGFGDPQVAEWQLVVRPMRPATFAEAAVDGVGIGGRTCAGILERHPEATGCTETETLQIDWDTEPLRYGVDSNGEAFIDAIFDDPVFVSVSYPTSADGLCDWSGSERLLPGTIRLSIDVGVACE
ncbi:MAG: hypothetical protein KJO84_01860 [Acidimicrobiia bacterium]|nr:hypothetical protein [Acidimicrobiia bacterium]